MAPSKHGHWILFLFGVPGVVRGLAQWHEEPWSTLRSVAFVSSMFLVAMGVVSLWIRRKNAVKASIPTPSPAVIRRDDT